MKEELNWINAWIDQGNLLSKNTPSVFGLVESQLFVDASTIRLHLSLSSITYFQSFTSNTFYFFQYCYFSNPKMVVLMKHAEGPMLFVKTYPILTQKISRDKKLYEVFD